MTTRQGPPSYLRLVVFNADGRLHKLAHEADLFMSHHNIDALLVPDSGHDSENIFAAFGDTRDSKARNRVFFTANRAARWSCAIVVRSHLPCSDAVLSDESGRALAVDVLASARGTRVHRLIALYQPPGLDDAPPDPAIPFNRRSTGTLTGLQLRGEAERLRQVVSGWSSGGAVLRSYLGADANETVCGPWDRARTAAQLPGRLHHGTIHGMIDYDGWGDVYGLLHPVPDEISVADTRGHLL